MRSEHFIYKLFVISSFFLVFLLLSSRYVSAAPPAEQYKFQDSQTIFANGGEYAEQIVFRSNTPFDGKNEFSTVLGHTVGGSGPRVGNCYLPNLSIVSFNSDGSQAMLESSPQSPENKAPSKDSRCSDDLIRKFHGPIQIDISRIKKETAAPGGDLIPQRVSVHVTIGTTAKGNQTVPKEYQSDEVTVEGPKNQPDSKKETLQSTYTLNKKTQDANDGYILQYLAISDEQHPPGSYTACSKTAQICVDFEKKPTDRTNVEIRNDSIVIKGVDTDKNGDIPDPAPAPPCAKEGEIPCTSFKTPFGNIPTNAAKFISATFGIILSVSGGIALLLIMRAGYKIMTSQGNQEAIKEGRDQLIAALVGLMFLIFSFVFLQLIGGDILKIPKFGGNPSGNDGSGNPPNINVEQPCSNDSHCQEGYTCDKPSAGSEGVCKAN